MLVTGAGGFLGTAAVEALRRRGYEVHAASGRRPPGVRRGVVWHRANPFDRAAIGAVVDRTRPTHLLHLAWDMRGASASGEPQSQIASLRGSLDLLHRVATSGTTRVVMVGSCAEYGANGGACSETSTALPPDTLYGIAKRALGNVLIAFARETGMSAAWARVFFTFGPGEPPDRLVPSVIRSVLAGEPAACTHGRQIRDYLYVEDVADALVALLDRPVQGAVNVGSGEPLRVADLARLIGELLGRPDLVRLGARPAGAHEPPVMVADVGRLRDEVRWTPRHTLREALEATIAWWRARRAREVAV